VDDDENDVSSDGRGVRRLGTLCENALRPRARESESERAESEPGRASDAGCEIDGAHARCPPVGVEMGRRPAARRDVARGDGRSQANRVTGGWESRARAKSGALTRIRDDRLRLNVAPF